MTTAQLTADLIKPSFRRDKSTFIFTPAKPLPNLDDLITEDDEPVDNLFSANQQHLLIDALYELWDEESFIAATNVGMFYDTFHPPLVPDVLVSLNVHVFPGNALDKRNRSYFLWEYKKPPEVVIELVSNKKGKEAGSKLQDYAKFGVRYYIIYDPLQQIGEHALRVYELSDTSYVETKSRWLADLGIGLMLWKGCYRGMEATWLRWCDRLGNPLLISKESRIQERQRAKQAKQQAKQAEQQAKQAEQQAKQAMQRAELLAAQLRALGVDPDKL
jgi:Uma2 family endonuclease